MTDAWAGTQACERNAVDDELAAPLCAMSEFALTGKAWDAGFRVYLQGVVC